MPTSKNPNAVVAPGPGQSGTIVDESAAVANALAALDAHILQVSGAHQASAIAYGGGSSWLDGTTNPAASVEGQLDKSLTDLISTTASHSGSDKIGSALLSATAGAGSTSAGSIYSQLLALKDASNIGLGARASWADGTTNPSASVTVGTAKIVSDLASTSGAIYIGAAALPTWADATQIGAGSVGTQLTSIVNGLKSLNPGTSGAEKIQTSTFTTWLDGTTNSGGRVRDAFDNIVVALSSQTTSHSGSDKIGVAARSNWLDGLTNPTTTGFGALNKIIADLSDSTGVGANGASRVGFAAQGHLASTTVETALAELDTNKGGLGISNTWTGANTFSNTFGVTLGGSVKIQFGSNRTVTRILDYPGNPDNNSNWNLQNDGSFIQVSSGHMIVWPLNLPHLSIIQGITVWVKAAVSATHPSNLASVTLPVITLSAMNTTSGSSVDIGGPTTDPSTTKGQYEAYHPIVMGNMTGGGGNLNLSLDRTFQKLALRLTGEAGTNFVAGLQIYAIAVGLTASQMDDFPC